MKNLYNINPQSFFMLTCINFCGKQGDLSYLLVIWMRNEKIDTKFEIKQGYPMIFIVMHKTCMTSSLTSSLESTSTNGLDLLALSFEPVASTSKFVVLNLDHNYDYTVIVKSIYKQQGIYSVMETLLTSSILKEICNTEEIYNNIETNIQNRRNVYILIFFIIVS